MKVLVEWLKYIFPINILENFNFFILELSKLYLFPYNNRQSKNIMKINQSTKNFKKYKTETSK